jgi:UDPglucose 6-dehydrogenase
MKIAVIGTGYVGLVTGTCFAEVGVDVTCVDVNESKIAGLRNGVMPIYEPGLEEMVKRNMQKQRLHFSSSIEPAMKDAEVAFIAVGTPPDEDGSADLKYVLAAASDIGRCMQAPMVVVTKSTVPVTTAEKVRQSVQEALDQRGVSIRFHVASNPEFLKEGAAIEDFMKPDRIVIGTDSTEAEDIMRRLYKPFLLNGHPIIFMDIPSAEMTKYAANAMLATKISFMNDIANLCEIMGADVNMVRRGIGSDARIGPKFIYPGVGYGGSCFPKDVKALIRTAREKKYEMRILDAVEQVNDSQKEVLFNKVKKHYGNSIKGKQFAVWGLSFKPKTDDMREAPSLVIIERLLGAGATVVAYDPVAVHEAKRHLGDRIAYAGDMYDALDGSEALLIVTEWPEFRSPDLEQVAARLKNRVIFDGRNIFEPKDMKEAGFSYYCIGVPQNN